ncbi:hypothetical protein KDM41_09110 [bacterium]|nr:hypothetical protein [bacterium]
MAGAGKKWAIGCGIGCGLVLIILGGVGTCSYFAFKDIKTDAEGLDAGREQLRAEFGAAEDYTPNADGTVDAARLETFLAVREAIEPARREMSDMLSTLDGDAGIASKFKAGMKMVSSVMGFVGERNRVLLEQGMGVGEYRYLYTVAYFGMLGKDPADGPSFVLAGDGDHEDDGGVRMTWNNDDEDEVRDGRARFVRREVHRLQTAILENQLAALESTVPAAGDPWTATLQAEVAAMRAESLRFAWEEGLPDPLRASLEPFRDRLEAGYDPMTSLVELGFGHDD